MYGLKLTLLALGLGPVNAAQPNILYYLIDDLGWAGLGFNSPSGEPKTPYIDSLRGEGVQLERFYTFRVCSPTRSSFLSGRLPYHVNQVNRECNQAGGGVPVNMSTVADVMKRGGYRTHHLGKWHVGMSVKAKIPINRGFDSSLAMLGGSQHHFTQVHGGFNKVPAFVDLWRDHGPAYGENGTYSSYLYGGEAVRIINAHDVSLPLFMYVAFPLVHGPLEVEDKFLNLYDESIHHERRVGLGMISAVDEAITNITEALKARGMYENSLIIVSSDNGGEKEHESNFPLRGCKSSNFDGGSRVVAFASGGLIPEKMRGGATDALMHIADMYATFARLAGVDPTDERAAAAGLPPIDSVDMVDVLFGNAAVSNRTELVLAAGQDLNSAALIWQKNGKLFKLIRGTEGNAFYPGPTTPNGTTEQFPAKTSCPNGCMFEHTTDEVEHIDVTAAHPDRYQKMLARMAELDAEVFQEPNSENKNPRATAVGNSLGGWWAPWEDWELEVAV